MVILIWVNIGNDAQIMMTPYHFMNQWLCLLVISNVLWHSPGAISQQMLMMYILDMSLKNSNLRLQPQLPGVDVLLMPERLKNSQTWLFQPKSLGNTYLVSLYIWQSSPVTKRSLLLPKHDHPHPGHDVILSLGGKVGSRGGSLGCMHCLVNKILATFIPIHQMQETSSI